MDARPAPPPGLPVRPDTLMGPGSSVPYVAQGPLLCGGASAAMIERFWGALGVYADDYAHLVTRPAGIRTGDLARTLAGRGYQVTVFRDDPGTVLADVRDGVPVVVLLESGESAYHYVVVVAAGPEQVRFHDPIRAPGRTVSRSEFLRRWAPSDYWALMAFPEPGAEEAARGPLSGRAGPDEPGRHDPGADDPAGQGDGAAAALPATLQAALEDLRADRPEAAVARAEAYLRTAPGSDPRRGLARQMLASARYLAGDALGALEAWNRDGDPPVDLVRVRGLRAQRYRTVAEPMGVRPREVLTPRVLRLARRRLLQLPAVRLGRVGYQPLRDGSVEVQAAILERRRWPLDPMELAGIGLGALVNQRAEVELGPILGVGERWRLRGGWEEARRLVEGAVELPWPPVAGVVTLRHGWTEERLAPLGADRTRTRTWRVATLRRWMAPDTRLGLSVGLEGWEGRVGRIGVEALQALLGDDLRLAAMLDGWGDADRRYGRARLAVLLRREAQGREWSATVGGTLASDGAPPTLWDGAGTGRVRAPLLRGHPLVREDRIGRDAFGRGLLHGSLAHAWLLAAGPGRAALALFVDGARVWDPLVGDGPRSYLDPGVELSLSEGERIVALSLARGGSDWVLSARVGTAVLPWLSAR